MPVQRGLWTCGQVEGLGSFSRVLSRALKWFVLSVCIFSRKVIKYLPLRGF